MFTAMDELRGDMMKKPAIFLGLLLIIWPTVLLGSTLSISSNSADPGDSAVIVSVALDNGKLYSGAEIEINYDYSVLTLNRVETAARLAGISETGAYEYMPGKISLVFFDLSGQTLAADSGDIFDIYFDVSPYAGEVNTEITVAEVTAVDDVMDYDVVTATSGFIMIPTYICGDMEGNRIVNLLDITYLINHLYKGGPEPNDLNAADVNNDDLLNILDITYLINFLYKGGPAPNCDGAKGTYASKRIGGANESAEIIYTVNDGRSAVTLETPVDLYGLEITLNTPVSDVSMKCTRKDLKLFFYQNGEEIRLAILDIMGEKFIPKGKSKILEIGGEVEIVSALGADISAAPVYFLSENAIIPREFTLSQNYPNPFNPNTEIRFGLPKVSVVQLEIFNILGQRVTVLLNKKFDPGYHSVTWDGTNYNGQSVATGVYFYRLKAEGFVSSRKMLLLK